MLNFKKFIEPIICNLLLAVIVFAPACSSDTVVEVVGVGFLTPTVVVDGRYTDAKTLSSGVLDVSKYSVPSFTLKSAGGGYEHTWENWKDFNSGTGLNAGIYNVSCEVGNCFSEGFSQPWFKAERDITINGGVTENCELVCSLANSMVNVSYSEAFLKRFEGGNLILHSFGGDFIDYQSEKSEPVFMKSGDAVSMIDFCEQDRPVRVFADDLNGMKPGYLYGINVDYIPETANAPEKVILNYEGINDNSRTELSITGGLLNGMPVDVECVGFESGVTTEIPEGCEPQNPIIVSVSNSGLKRLMLSLSSASPVLDAVTKEIDLLASEPELSKLKGLGLKLTINGNDIEVDFSEFIASLVRNYDFPESEISIYTVSTSGLMSEPAVIKVNTTVPVVESVGTAMSVEGADRAAVELKTNANITRYCSIEVRDNSGVWRQSENVIVNDEGNGMFRVLFDVPEDENVSEARLIYMGKELCRFAVVRTSPEFTITVDAFALQAIVTVVCEDKSLREYVADNLYVFANDELLSVSHRDLELGTVLVTGLKENTSYLIRASIFQNPTSANYVSPAVSVVTETCAQLPNSGFEDIEKGISYKNLPSGGRFSQTIVPIYNMQNYVSYELNVPKRWANCNAKTFCKSSTVHNSWYMQPSVYTVNDPYSGNYAVKLQSVGWDCKGEPIADYLQIGQPYLNYSRVIPDIAYRAAGKLFLGSYEFNPSTTGEIYVNGISFPSRPMALNGYYKYNASRADVSDRGVVNVELTGLVNGAEVVVANGTGYLLPTGSYRAFTVDLNYRLYNVKAYRLKIMLASSEDTGNISYETEKVKTYSNELTASSVGSELWIDELKLSY